jgi:hypothetical protein
MKTPDPEHSEGQPVELGDAWTLRKGVEVARCVLVLHRDGWELRLLAPELIRSQVFCSSSELLDTADQWKAEMIAKGWWS